MEILPPIKKIPQLILNSQTDTLHINQLSKLFNFHLPSTIIRFNQMCERKLSLNEILTKQRITKFLCLNPTDMILFNVEKIKEMDFRKVDISMSKFLEKVINNPTDVGSFSFDIKIGANDVEQFRNKLLQLKDNIINIQGLKNCLEKSLNVFNSKYNCVLSNCDGQREFVKIKNGVKDCIKYLNVDLNGLYETLESLFDEQEKIIPRISYHKHVCLLINDMSSALNDEVSKVLNFNSKIKRNDNHFKVVKSLIKHIEQLKPIMLGANNQGAFFTTSLIKKLTEDRNQFLEIQRVFEWYEMGKIYKILQPYMKDLEKIMEIINLLDMHQAYSRSNFKNAVFIENKGSLCDKCKALELDLNTESIKDVQLMRFAHPLIPDCVKNDFVFYENFIKLSGPNTSGKSTILRSVSLIIYLSQIGAPSCSEMSFIKYFDCIRIRIGSADKEGQSSFMVEMNELSEIIKTIETVEGNLLVLIDELGRGTSINDGLAISKGIMEYLKRKSNVFSIFVTHFHELDARESVGKIETWSLKNYKLIKGSNLSFGIECAKECGFPKSVIENSYKYYNEKD